MRRHKHHHVARAMQRQAGKSKLHWRFKKMIAVFYQLLLPLIIFQLIRTILLPTTLDVLILTLFVVLYIMYRLP